MPTKRIPYIDLAKGICILLVVAGHVFRYFGFDDPFTRTISMFRMPLYYILSGLFFKTYEGPVGFAVRKTNKLLIPYVFFILLSLLLIPTLLGKPVPRSFWGAYDTVLHYNHPLWFLGCLFEVNLIFYALQMLALRFMPGRQVMVVMSVSCLTGIVGMTLAVRGVTLPALLGFALVGLPFFAFGWWLHRHTDFLHAPFVAGRDWVLIVVLLAAVALMTGEVKYGNNEFDHKAMITAYPAGLMGTIAMLLLAKRIGHLPVVSYCGRYSIIILCTHYITLQALKYPIIHVLHPTLTVLAWTDLALTLLVSIALIPVGRHLLPHVTAQKNLLPTTLFQPKAKPEGQAGGREGEPPSA